MRMSDAIRPALTPEHRLRSDQDNVSPRESHLVGWAHDAETDAERLHQLDRGFALISLRDKLAALLPPEGVVFGVWDDATGPILTRPE
jgi:hypothetical protein